MCGGTALPTRRSHHKCGLSPRVRGNPRSIPACPPQGRSIPACAGEPPAAGVSQRRSQVYPRVCGGTRHRVKRTHTGQGLSPRVRGNPSRPHIGRQNQRSIPACAGEPRRQTSVPGAYQVYPRVCGGTPHRRHRPLRRSGLSPRVRGNRIHRRRSASRPGSIPACAGEPERRTAAPRRDRVYPRVCGGTRHRPSGPTRPAGLSPRVRGNHHVGEGTGVVAGSIPACAGEPATLVGRIAGPEVYPRVCGGTAVKLGPPARPCGLSPRVRGNLGPDIELVGRRRSIPACAGEPGHSRRGQTMSRVYPRVCGGTWWAAGLSWWAGGLSPRVRGNPDCRAGY